jgi:hypothetical protein
MPHGGIQPSCPRTHPRGASRTQRPRRTRDRVIAETSDDVAAAEAFFSDMPFPVRVHWTNGPAVAESLQSLQSLGLNVTGPPGKGLGCVAGAWCGLQER